MKLTFSTFISTSLAFYLLISISYPTLAGKVKPEGNPEEGVSPRPRTKPQPHLKRSRSPKPAQAASSEGITKNDPSEEPSSPKRAQPSITEEKVKAKRREFVAPQPPLASQKVRFLNPYTQALSYKGKDQEKSVTKQFYEAFRRRHSQPLTFNFDPQVCHLRWETFFSQYTFALEENGEAKILHAERKTPATKEDLYLLKETLKKHVNGKSFGEQLTYFSTFNRIESLLQQIESQETSRAPRDVIQAASAAPSAPQPAADIDLLDSPKQPSRTPVSSLLNEESIIEQMPTSSKMLRAFQTGGSPVTFTIDPCVSRLNWTTLSLNYNYTSKLGRVGRISHVSGKSATKGELYLLLETLKKHMNGKGLGQQLNHLSTIIQIEYLLQRE